MSSPFNQRQVLSLSSGGERQIEVRTGSLEKLSILPMSIRQLSLHVHEPEGSRACASWCSCIRRASCTRHPLVGITSLQHRGAGQGCHGGPGWASLQIGPSTDRLPWVGVGVSEPLSPWGKLRVGYTRMIRNAVRSMLGG